MKRFETESGAVYLWDVDNKRVVRLSGAYNPQIQIGNGSWLYYEYATVNEGFSAVFLGDVARTTTPVIRVEDVPDE